MKVILLGLLLMTPALAQSSDEFEACRQDARRLCKFALQGNAFTVASCLAANKAKISPRCRAVLTSHGM